MKLKGKSFVNENGQKIYTDKIEFIERTKRLLEEYKSYDKQTYTQEGFAENLGIGTSTLKKYLNKYDPNMPELDTLIKMCELLFCDLDYLAGRIERTTHSEEDACKCLGFNDKAGKNILILKELEDDNPNMNTLNRFIEKDSFLGLLELFQDLLNLLDKRPPYVHITTEELLSKNVSLDKIQAEAEYMAYSPKINALRWELEQQFNRLLDEIIGRKGAE